MKFAKVVFWVAGIWGLLVLTPLYFLYDYVGRQDPPAVTHPQFYYGFVGVALVWQLLFLTIASDPARYRPMMVLALLEKASYVIALSVLWLQHRVALAQFMTAVPDSILGVLFVVAFWKTGADAGASSHR